MTDKDDQNVDQETEREEFLRRRKRKNLALGVTVGGLILLIYVVSIIRMSGG